VDWISPVPGRAAAHTGMVSDMCSTKCSGKKYWDNYIPGGVPALPPCWVIIMSSTRMSMMAVSEALWMDWRLDRSGSTTPSASMSMTLPS